MKLGGCSGLNWYWEYYTTEEEARQAAQNEGRERWSVRQLPEPVQYRIGLGVNTKTIEIPAGAWELHAHF